MACIIPIHQLCMACDHNHTHLIMYGLLLFLVSSKYSYHLRVATIRGAASIPINTVYTKLCSYVIHVFWDRNMTKDKLGFVLW